MTQLITMYSLSEIHQRAVKQFGEVVTLFVEGAVRPSTYDNNLSYLIETKLEEIGYDPNNDLLIMPNTNYVLTARLLTTATSAYGTVGVLVYEYRLDRFVKTKMGLELEEVMENDGK